VVIFSIEGRRGRRKIERRKTKQGKILGLILLFSGREESDLYVVASRECLGIQAHLPM
jgi:hypothetical protein